MEGLFKQYKKTHLTHANFSRVPMLAALPPQDETVITSLFRLVAVPAGSVLVEEADPCRDVFMVCRGVVALFETDDEDSICVAHVPVSDVLCVTRRAVVCGECTAPPQYPPHCALSTSHTCCLCCGCLFFLSGCHPAGQHVQQRRLAE